MSNRRYSLEEKIRFLDLYKEKRSMTATSLAVGVKLETARYWVKHEQKLREEYERSLQPVDMTVFDAGPRRYRTQPLEEKVRCIMAVEAGLSFNQAAKEFDTSLSTVQGWYKAKDGLLALYYSQKDDGERGGPKELVEFPSSSDVLGEDWMDKEQADKELAKTIKAQAREIEYLKDRVAFLESLNEILKERSGPVKKKSCSRRSPEASVGGGGT